MVRIKHPDKRQQGMQAADIGGIIVVVTTASYTEQKPIFHKLCDPSNHWAEKIVAVMNGIERSRGAN